MSTGALSSPSTRVWLRALRCHQWAKNLLVFVPVLAAHRLKGWDQVALGIAAFLTFSLCASSVYLLNDIVDVEDDKQHPTKRFRPLAAGLLGIHECVVALVILLFGSFTGALWILGRDFTLVLSTYFVLTLAYSFVVKRWVVADVVALALLYTLRLIAGSAALRVKPTFWMLAFSTFLFLSLALLKRYSELRRRRQTQVTGRVAGRGYDGEDLELLASMGNAAGYLSVLVLALYVQDESTRRLYTNPWVIGLVCPLLLYWISRIWILGHRGAVTEDPVLFTLKDPVSWGILAGAGALVAIAV